MAGRISLGILAILAPVRAFSQTASLPSAAPAAASPQGSQAPPSRITLDDAIDLALKHNHSLQAARTTILQNQAEEITANLRPNPVGLIDEQYMPFFSPRAKSRARATPLRSRRSFQASRPRSR